MATRTREKVCVVTDAHDMFGRFLVPALLAPSAARGWTHLRLVNSVIPDDAHELYQRYTRLAALCRNVSVTFHCASFLLVPEMELALESAVLVYHLLDAVDARSGGWPLPHRDFFQRINVDGTRILLSAMAPSAAAAPVVVYVSSAAAAAPSASGYGASKAAAENLVLEAARTGKLRAALVVRAGVIIKPTSALAHSATLLMGMDDGALACAPIYAKNLAAYVVRAGDALRARPDELSGATVCPRDAECTQHELYHMMDTAKRRKMAKEETGAEAEAEEPAESKPGRAIPCLMLWTLILTLLLKMIDCLLWCGRIKFMFLQLSGMSSSPAVVMPKAAAMKELLLDANGVEPPPPFEWPHGVLDDIAETAAAAATTGRASAARGAAAAFSNVFMPLTMRGVVLRNRIIKAATYEAGCSNDGVPKSSLIDFHASVAAGGAALTTIAYASVSSDGRSFATQLLVNSAAAPGLTALTGKVHARGGKVAIQLTHAGYFADRKVTGEKQISASVVFNPAGMDWPRAMTERDMDRVVDDFTAAAALAVRCGVDVIQLHLGHGYLLAQFLSPHTNRRSDRYGGRAALDRLRFPLRVVKAVRAVLGATTPLVCKMNLTDGFDGGITLTDATKFAQAIDAAGCDMIIPSGGWISRNGFYMLRGVVPLLKMQAALKWGVKRIAILLFGRFFVPTIPWTPTFFSHDAARLIPHVRAAHVCLIGGVNSLKAMENAVDNDGFAAVAIARALLREPDFVNRIARQSKVSEGHTTSKCSHCNECIVGSTMAETPLRCVEREW